MAKPMSRVEAEAALRSDGRAQHEALLRLPPDADPQLVAKALLGFRGRSWWAFARNARKLTAPMIDAVLAGLEEDRSAPSVFLREVVRSAMPSVSLVEAWDVAIEGYLSLDSTYAWGSKQRRAKFADLARDPRTLAGCQAAAAGCADASTSMLAVLATDASDASIDALMPHFVGAQAEGDGRLDRLERLKTHARDTDGMRAMLAEIERALGVRNAASPALALAGPLGLGDVKELWFSVFLGSREHTAHRVPRFQAHVDVDSRSDVWFTVHVSELSGVGASGGISFNVRQVWRDTFGVGPCEARDLPGWLARVAGMHGIDWDFAGASVRTGLRGKKRDAVLRWLRGAT